MREWLRGLASSLSDWYDEGKNIGGNFVGWCGDAPVVVIVLVGSTALLFGGLLLVGYFSDLIRQFSTPKSVIRGSGVSLQILGFVLAAVGLERPP